MFFRRSTACHILRGIVKAAAYGKPFDSFQPTILPQRLAGTSLSSRIKESKTIEEKSNVIDRAKEGDGSISAGGDTMPPEKLKLATKVKNLTSTRKVKSNYRKLNLTTRGEGTDSNKSDRVTKTNLTTELSVLVEAASEASSIMENAIAKSKLNLRNLRPKVSEEKTDEPKSSKSSNKRSLKAVVDIEMMKSELKQLEDPPITPEEKLLSANRLGFEFFDVDCETLAKNLLGKILVRKLENGTLLKGKIVETESYLGGDDKASQTYQNKVTPRNIPMYMPPGTIYVYLTYGMYHCFNVSSRGTGSVVLIRALSPIEGQKEMAELRNMKPTANSKSRSLRDFKNHELSNGPSKFCMAFGLNRDHSKYSMCDWKGMWIEDNQENGDIKIVKCARIGIDSAGPEWALKPLRFYILGEDSVSKKDKKAEAAIDK